MTTDEDLRRAVEALDTSILIVGGGSIDRSAARRIASGDAAATDATEPPNAVLVALDASQFEEGTVPPIPDVPAAPMRLAIVTVPDRPTAGEQMVLESLADRVDTVILATGCGVENLTTAVSALVSIVRGSGIVNIDLADAETVFQSVHTAALCTGVSSDGDPTAAVRNAFNALAGGVETDPACGVLVDLVGSPEISVADISEAVSTVRTFVGPDAHVIWGGSIDDDLTDEIRVRLVLAGVTNGRVAPGDDCPRCGTPLSAYTLSERTMLSCDSCGFAGVTVRLRE